MEDFRGDWANMMLPASSGGGSGEAQTLSAQVDDMQSESLDMLGSLQKEIQQIYLQVVGEMNNMKQNLNKAKRDMIQGTQKGLQDINKARRKYERKARTLARKSEKNLAKA